MHLRNVSNDKINSYITIIYKIILIKEDLFFLYIWFNSQKVGRFSRFRVSGTQLLRLAPPPQGPLQMTGVVLRLGRIARRFPPVLSPERDAR